MNTAPSPSSSERSALRQLAEELREYTAMKYAGDCKCGKCQLVPRALVERIYHTLNGAAIQRREAPEGYVIMPREATRVMTMAGCDSLPSCEHVFGHAGEMLKNAYAKMVEVCGHPPQSVDAAQAAPPSLPDVLESCKIEHKEFDKWAASKGYSMEEHPLHYLFLEPRTYAARQGWKAALEYVARAVALPSTDHEGGK